MIRNTNPYGKAESRVLRIGYMLLVFFLALTGFGQMPIFKRYYIADIPGLGWLAKFYVTHYIHYLGAIVLLALIGFVLVQHLLMDRQRRRSTASGYLRGFMLGGIVISGVFLVVRNLKGIWFPPEFIIFLNLAHLGLVMVFLGTLLYCRLAQKRWTQVRHHGM